MMVYQVRYAGRNQRAVCHVRADNEVPSLPVYRIYRYLRLYRGIEH